MKLKLNGFLAFLLVLITQISFAQDRTVSGTVTDKDGLPVPTANVKVKGTSTGTQTDFDGKYKIKANADQTLVFSFLGMKTQEVSAANTTVNVKLASSNNELTEVVVTTALGIKKSEKSIGYAAQNIAGSSLTEARESNIVNALSGKIAGVQVTNTSGAVGASSRIVLRGNSSISGNNEALFVVDGIPMDNSSQNGVGYDGVTSNQAGSGGGRDLPNGVASLNPDDIESITVLKGPTAAALYGMRAGNGVVVITTKSGKKGKGFGLFSLNSNMTFSNPLVIPNFQNSYGQGATSNYFEFVDGAGGGSNDGVDESWGAPLDRGLSFVQWDSYKVGGAPLPWISQPNNVKDFYNTGFTRSNSVSMTGGSETANIRISLGNSEEDGIIPFTEFKKFNIGFNANLKLGEKLSVGANATYFNDKSDNLPTGGYSSENAVQQFIWSARNVKFTDLKDWRNLPMAPVGTAAEGTPLNWNNNFQNNPYWVLENNINTYNRDRILGGGNMVYKFSNSFSATGKIGVDSYSQITSGRQARGTNSFADGSYGENSLRYFEINSEFLLSYKNKITDDISYNLNFGGNRMRRTITQTYGSAPALELPNLYTLSNIKSGSTLIAGNNLNENKINSLYGFGQVAYKEILFVDFTARNDWSSLFAKSNNSFFYPSVTGSLVLSELFSDMKSSKLNYLKLRAGWSKVGNSGALRTYQINRTYDLNLSGWGNQAFTPNTQVNPNIRPESVSGTEIGIDLNAFNKRLRFSGTYYTKTSKDLIVDLQVSRSTGYSRTWENVAEMENKGIELQLGVTALKTNDFSLDIDFNFAKNNNLITDLGGYDSYILGGQWGVSLEARPGQPWGSLVGRGFERDGAGNVIYLNGLPKIESTQKILGNVTPDWTGGVSLSMKYKDFDFSSLIDAKMGGDVHSMTYAWGRYAGTLEETLIGRETGVVGNGVMQVGTNTNGSPIYAQNNVVVSAKEFNQNSFGNTIEESAIFDASYVKLRQLSLGYTLPKKWLKGSFVEDFKFSLVGRNLAILYKNVPHIDPETGFSSANGEQGQEFGQIPSTSSYGFNINVKF